MFLKLFSPSVPDLQRELVLDLVVDAARNGYAARLGDRLDACRDVHPVAEQVSTLHDHVAQVDADAKPHPLVFGQVFVAGAQRRLDLGGAAHGLHGAGKLRQDGVARGIEDPAAVRLEQLVENLAVAAQGAHGALLVLAHEPAVAVHVGHQDRRQPALDGCSVTRVGRIPLHCAKLLTAVSQTPCDRRALRADEADSLLLQQRHIECDVGLRPIGRGVVEGEFSGQAGRRIGGERERRGRHGTGILEALIVQRNPVIQALAGAEVDGHAIADGALHAHHGLAGSDLGADIGGRENEMADRYLRIKVVRTFDKPPELDRGRGRATLALVGQDTAGRVARSRCVKRDGEHERDAAAGEPPIRNLHPGTSLVHAF